MRHATNYQQFEGLINDWLTFAETDKVENKKQDVGNDEEHLCKACCILAYLVAMELQVLRPAVLNSTLTSAWCSLPISPGVELKRVVIGSMTATTVVNLVHDGFDFQVESAQIVAEGGKDTDEHQTWQVKWELDHFIEGLLASVTIRSELVRWLQDHED